MADNTENTNTELTPENEEGQEKKTYTEEEVAKMLQAETDRRVTAALNKQKKSYEQKLSLSQLDGEAREKAEKDNRIKELEEQVREFTKLQTKTEVVKTLTARGLNPSFADFVDIGEDANEAQEKIEQLDKLFKSAVADEVKKRLAGNAPKTGGTDPASITKEQFNKMTLAQQSALYRDNPELYKRLTN